MIIDVTAQAAPVIWTTVGLTAYCVLMIAFSACPPKQMLEYFRRRRPRLRLRSLTLARMNWEQAASAADETPDSIIRVHA
jgi:hypothetical protein